MRQLTYHFRPDNPPEALSPTLYSPEFYDAIEAGCRASAAVIVPLLIEVFHPKSVIDFGCGRGAFLKEFKTRGVERVVGVDGPWVEHTVDFTFREADIKTPGLDFGRFDLALCLEVAEHIPPGWAPTLVDTLCRHADVVVFSAAISGQGGVGHVNEQWPSWWAKLFEKRSYFPYDVRRWPIWINEQVCSWYRQNLIGFKKGDPAKCSWKIPEMLDVVHPAFWSAKVTG